MVLALAYLQFVLIIYPLKGEIYLPFGKGTKKSTGYGT
jgi:hypothetical protein